MATATSTITHTQAKIKCAGSSKSIRAQNDYRTGREPEEDVCRAVIKLFFLETFSLGSLIGVRVTFDRVYGSVLSPLLLAFLSSIILLRLSLAFSHSLLSILLNVIPLSIQARHPIA